MKPFRLQTIVLIAIILATSACTRSWPVTPTPSASPQLDPIFQDFYYEHGGEDIFGPPISQPFEQNGLRMQYVEAALLVFHPEAPTGQAIFLAPLGLEMGVNEPPVPPPPPDSPDMFINGHSVYPGFEELFMQLGGVSVVGPPLHNARYNPEHDRVEQFFGNMGFYSPTRAEAIEVHALAYGAWKCSFVCRHTPPLNAAIDLDARNQGVEVVEQPAEPVEVQTGVTLHLPMIVQLYPARAMLTEALSRLTTDLSGYALTDVYVAADGMLEQIYENVVVYADPQQPDHFALRPLPEMVAIPAGQPEQPSADETMTFVETAPGTGFNVSAAFLQYLRLHGGLDLSGLPTGAYAPLDEDVNMQCFRFYCLEEHKNTPDGLVVRPAPLGYRYMELYYSEENNPAFESNEPVNEVSIQYWEKYPMVASNQSQEIEVAVLENRSPLAGTQPTLVVSVPGKPAQEYKFPPTGVDGRTSLILSPVDAPNSSVISYQVCISTQPNESFCVLDQYLLWNAP